MPKPTDRQGARTAWRLGAVLCLLVFFASGSTLLVATPSQAQGTATLGAGASETTTYEATVQAIDYQERTLTLVGPAGKTKTMTVGKEVRNFSQIHPGDAVIAQYQDSVAYVIAPPGTKAPEDMLAIAEARAAQGEKPAGGVASKLVITGLVTGVDVGAHTISIVDPTGGKVRTFTVKNPTYRNMLPSIKAGDKITAVVAEALVVAVDPVR